MPTLPNSLGNIQTKIYAEENFILGQMAALKSAIHYHIDNDFAVSISSAEKAITLLPSSEQGALGTALGFLALSLQATGQSAEGVKRLQKTLADPRPQGPAEKQILLGLSFTHLFSGNLYALDRASEKHKALATANQSSIPAPHWIAGIAAYEANQLDAALDSWKTTTDSYFATNFVAACDSWLGMARIYQIRGDLELAQQCISAANAEGLRLNCSDLLPVIAGVQALQWHLQGETAAAQRWMAAFQLMS